jgi:uncharacterized protein
MLRLDEGQDLFATLSGFAKDASVRAGVIVSGIGMVRHATVGYWNGREYSPKEITVPHELVALHGSLAVVDGAPSVHLHASLSGPDHGTVSGHLMRATIGVLAEIYVETFPTRTFGRPMNETIGLRGLDLEPGPSP